MSDLISRQAAINAINEVFVEDEQYKTWFELAIKKLPSAQPERKTGKWVKHHEPYTWMGYTSWSCSECNFGEKNNNKTRSNFCPNCGADMRGE